MPNRVSSDYTSDSQYRRSLEREIACLLSVTLVYDNEVNKERNCSQVPVMDVYKCVHFLKSVVIIRTNFDILLTLHLSITLANDQLDAQFLYFIIRLLQSLYMFRTTSCSSSGGQILLIQHLVSSL